MVGVIAPEPVRLEHPAAVVSLARTVGADAVHPGGQVPPAGFVQAVESAGLTWLGSTAWVPQEAPTPSITRGWIDVGVLADRHGSCVALGLAASTVSSAPGLALVETDPPHVTGPQQFALAQVAVDHARTLRHTHAGVVRLRLDADGRPAQAHLSPRLSPLHGLLDWVTGINTATWELKVAHGERLPWVHRPQLRGHGVACTLRALPRPGRDRLDAILVPSGKDVRWNGVMATGQRVAPKQVIGQLVARAETRRAAVAALRVALQEIVVVGTQTTQDAHLRLLEEPIVCRDDALPASLDATALAQRSVPADKVRASAIARSLQGRGSPAAHISPWAQLARYESLVP